VRKKCEICGFDLKRKLQSNKLHNVQDNLRKRGQVIFAGTDKIVLILQRNELKWDKMQPFTIIEWFNEKGHGRILLLAQILLDRKQDRNGIHQVSFNPLNFHIVPS
jgi:hypothetical protein